MLQKLLRPKASQHLAVIAVFAFGWALFMLGWGYFHATSPPVYAAESEGLAIQQQPLLDALDLAIADTTVDADERADASVLDIASNPLIVLTIAVLPAFGLMAITLLLRQIRRLKSPSAETPATTSSPSTTAQETGIGTSSRGKTAVRQGRVALNPSATLRATAA